MNRELKKIIKVRFFLVVNIGVSFKNSKLIYLV